MSRGIKAKRDHPEGERPGLVKASSISKRATRNPKNMHDKDAERSPLLHL